MKGSIAPRLTVVDRIRHYNTGREPERLERKYRAMWASPFGFYHGTCHLFYEDLPADAPVLASPLAWSPGDLHLENFGSFKGENRLTYFDVNDFDEGCLIPAGCDLARLVASVFLGAEAINLTEDQAIALGETFLESYCAALRTGRPG